MKENVIDVLLYLFENYIDTDESIKQPDKDVLETELEKAGFPQLEIHKAFGWLESMTVAAEETHEGNVHKDLAVRIFIDEESERLDVECRGYLLFLEQVGILDEITREIVIERVMALETEEIELQQMKWVILMVLFYQPGRESAYAWMEDLVFDDMVAVIH